MTETVSLEKWKSTFDIDMASSFLVVRDYWEQLAQATEEQRERASVVLVGSTVGKYGERGHVDYAAAKSGALFLALIPCAALMLFTCSDDVRIHDDT